MAWRKAKPFKKSGILILCIDRLPPVTISPEEALRRTEEFISDPARREQLIAPIRDIDGPPQVAPFPHRPRRAIITPEEALRRMQTFGSERAEAFITSCRESKK